MDTAAKIEALLFWKSEPVAVAKLAELVEETEITVRGALAELKSRLEHRGLQLLENGAEVTLGTNPELGPLFDKLTKEEFSGDIGRAGLEALTIILYQGPIARARIDYIRGVNSSFILRHLMVRGLIERLPNPEDARSFLYKATFDLLAHLGITKVDDLPEYAALADKLKAIS